MNAEIPLSEDRKALLIAALFHDIGKFQYRAERTTEPHQNNSAHFIREQLRRFTALRDIVDQAADWAAAHHGQGAPSALIQADQLSAAERVEDEEQVARRPLESIFARLRVHPDVPLPEGPFCLWPKAIAPEAVFPERGEKDWKAVEARVMEAHRQAWEGFQKELAGVPEHLDFGGLIHTLYALLERWCARVAAAAYRAVPDISLFDHLRVTAAYADCLQQADDPDRPFLVIQGDLGGIQRFLYRLRTPEAEQKGTAKQLRGRSFSIRLINDTLAYWILDELGLFRPNLILTGGGHFLILAPSRRTCQERLRELRWQANEWFLREFHQDLSLVLEWEAFSAQQMRDFGQVSEHMARKLADAKLRRAKDLLASRHLFGPFEDEKAEIEACPICQALVTDRQRFGGKCPTCALHQEIGGAMPSTGYLIEVSGLDPQQLDPSRGRVLVPFPVFRRAWYLAKGGRGGDLEQIIADAPAEAKLRIIAVGTSNFLDPEVLRVVNLRRALSSRVALDFLFQANFLPRDGKGDVLSFEEMAQRGKTYPYLGFLRADVDDLGYLFAHGFEGGGQGTDNRSLSRFATLSRELDLFFSGYVDQLAEKYDLYITYSGGDDLFVVGHWENVLEFALELQQRFAEMTCGNRNLGLSAGLLIERPDFPVRFAAEAAQEAQERAKARAGTAGQVPDPGKRAFCLFDRVHPWERARQLLEYGKELRRIVEQEHELRALVRHVFQLSQSLRSEKGEDLVAYPKLRARLHYALARRADVTARSMDDPEASAKVKVFARLISEPDLFREFAVPAQYLLLATRRVREKAQSS